MLDVAEQIPEVVRLKNENAKLLTELESAYKNMELILEQNAKEKEITYQELQRRYHALENLYSELSHKENMLVHLEKLSSIGQFITEIIHELNNPLTIIKGSTELLLFNELPEMIESKLKIIDGQTDRMSAYLKRFKAMAYKGEEHFVPFDVNTNLSDFMSTIQIIKPKNISVEQELCDDDLPVMGDPYQITQIYLNLAKNAFDAMEEHGSRFTVSTSKITKMDLQNESLISPIRCCDDSTWQETLNNNEHFALIECRDDGNGMRPEMLESIFQPFFTTKPRGKGTGLGLSIATDITERHYGLLCVKSELKIGTTFQLILPLSNS